MERANEQLAQLIENMPVRLDRFWRARLLKKHQTEQHLYESLKMCMAENSGKCSLEVMSYLRERRLLSNFIAAS